MCAKFVRLCRGLVLSYSWAPSRSSGLVTKPPSPPRLFTCRQRLEAVVTKPCRGAGSSFGLHALQKFCEENRTAFDLSEVVSVNPNPAPRTSLDPAVTVQTPRTSKRSVSSVSPSAAVTDKRGRTEKAQRNTKVARLSTLKSVPRVGPILWVDLVGRKGREKGRKGRKRGGMERGEKGR